MCKATVDEYQAFALAVKAGGGQEEYDAHGAYQARVPGGGGEAYDWGDSVGGEPTTLDSMVEQLGTPRLAGRGLIHSKLTAVEKHMAFSSEAIAKDKRLEDELVHVRNTVKTFLDDDALGEAEVTPVGTPEATTPAEGAAEDAAPEKSS